MELTNSKKMKIDLLGAVVRAQKKDKTKKEKLFWCRIKHVAYMEVGGLAGWHNSFGVVIFQTNHWVQVTLGLVILTGYVRVLDSGLR